MSRHIDVQPCQKSAGSAVFLLPWFYSIIFCRYSLTYTIMWKKISVTYTTKQRHQILAALPSCVSLHGCYNTEEKKFNFDSDNTTTSVSIMLPCM